MHLLVLSAFRLEGLLRTDTKTRSQCTFWCSVLSDRHARQLLLDTIQRLNAPFGAQCFPTASAETCCSVHLPGLNAPFGAQCFPTRSRYTTKRKGETSQCTFWCSVLSDKNNDNYVIDVHQRLNAPFGAQCFPTEVREPVYVPMGLNAPFGAQCFPTPKSLAL